LKELSSFIVENRKSFPKYFKAKEIKKYHKENKLYKIMWVETMVGFYVVDGTQIKNLFIKKEYRRHSKLFLKEMFDNIKNKLDYATLAVNENSFKVKKLAIKNGFIATDNYVKGKTHRLRIYSWSSLSSYADFSVDKET